MTDWWDDIQALNEAVALSLGWKKTGEIWDRPDANHPAYNPPQFHDGWKNVKLLVKSMVKAGYIGFELRRFQSKSWSAAFTCSIGPCPLHGTDFCNWHGSINVPGSSPGQAILFAAALALASGSHCGFDRDGIATLVKRCQGALAPD